MTNAALLDGLVRLTSRERLEFAYGLLDSVLHDQAVPAITDAQMHELRERLAHHRAHPNDSVVTLEDIRRKLVG